MMMTMGSYCLALLAAAVGVTVTMAQTQSPVQSTPSQQQQQQQQQQRYACNFSEPVLLMDERQQQVQLEHYTNLKEGTFTMRLTHTSEQEGSDRPWIGVGVNTDGLLQMIPAYAVVGQVEEEGSLEGGGFFDIPTTTAAVDGNDNNRYYTVSRYQLEARSDPSAGGVVRLDDVNFHLKKASFMQKTTVDEDLGQEVFATVLEFTHDLTIRREDNFDEIAYQISLNAAAADLEVDGNNEDNAFSGNRWTNWIWAVGESNGGGGLSWHSMQGVFSVDLQDTCEPVKESSDPEAVIQEEQDDPHEEESTEIGAIDQQTPVPDAMDVADGVDTGDNADENNEGQGGGKDDQEESNSSQGGDGDDQEEQPNDIGVNEALAGEGEEMELQDPDHRLWRIHGILMALAWGLLAPISIAIPLLRKQAFLAKDDRWLRIHFLSGVSVIVFTTAALAIAVVAQKPTLADGQRGDYFTIVHGAMGLLVFVLMMLLGIGGCCLPGQRLLDMGNDNESWSETDGDDEEYSGDNTANKSVKKRKQSGWFGSRRNRDTSMLPSAATPKGLRTMILSSRIFDDEGKLAPTLSAYKQYLPSRYVTTGKNRAVKGASTTILSTAVVNKDDGKKEIRVADLSPAKMTAACSRLESIEVVDFSPSKETKATEYSVSNNPIDGVDEDEVSDLASLPPPPPDLIGPPPEKSGLLLCWEYMHRFLGMAVFAVSLYTCQTGIVLQSDINDMYAQQQKGEGSSSWSEATMLCLFWGVVLFVMGASIFLGVCLPCIKERRRKKRVTSRISRDASNVSWEEWPEDEEDGEDVDHVLGIQPPSYCANSKARPGKKPSFTVPRSSSSKDRSKEFHC